MTEKAKLIYESEFDNRKVTLEFSPGADIYEFMEEVKKLALAIGYHPDSIDNGFEAMFEEVEASRREDTESENE